MRIATTPEYSSTDEAIPEAELQAWLKQKAERHEILSHIEGVPSLQVLA